MNYAQKQRALAKINEAKLPDYYELSSNREYLAKIEKASRLNLKEFEDKTVNFSGTLLAIRIREDRPFAKAHLLIKPAVVAGKKQDHIWCAVTHARFNKILRRYTDHINKSKSLYDVSMYFTDKHLVLNGRGVIQHYTRNPNKKHPNVNQDYGFKDAKWISVKLDDEARDKEFQTAK